MEYNIHSNAGTDLLNLVATKAGSTDIVGLIERQSRIVANPLANLRQRFVTANGHSPSEIKASDLAWNLSDIMHRTIHPTAHSRYCVAAYFYLETVEAIALARPIPANRVVYFNELLAANVVTKK